MLATATFSLAIKVAHGSTVCAISAAIFLVLELNRPLDGLIKVSSAPLRNAMQHLGQ
jgi:hypothetical protein